MNQKLLKDKPMTFQEKIDLIGEENTHLRAVIHALEMASGISAKYVDEKGFPVGL